LYLSAATSRCWTKSNFMQSCPSLVSKYHLQGAIYTLH
jgi:hypothetical protein